VGNKNFIEINGKKYDSVTGKMLDSAPATPQKKVTTITPQMNSGVVDGFTRRSPRKNTVHSNATPARKSPQKSQTLMRQTVKKPTPVAGKIAKAKPVIHKSHLGTSVKRTTIAMQTPKSQHVQKYGEINHRSSVVKTTSPNLAVKPEPTHVASNHSAQSTNQHHTNTSPHSANPTATQKMLGLALENATAHQNEHVPTHHKKRRSKLTKKLGISARAMGLSSAVLAAVLLGGFFAVQNVPNLSMRLAASRAGFDASMPSYQPTGFSFKGPINYSPGRVTISYVSNTDNRQYDVKQQASNWNSDALLSNFVVAEGKTYQTYLDRGRTLFIYDESNATWVDNGVWYQIEGESDMTTDQLIRIASSI
jgi:hypothetical protein